MISALRGASMLYFKKNLPKKTKQSLVQTPKVDDGLDRHC